MRKLRRARGRLALVPRLLPRFEALRDVKLRGASGIRTGCLLLHGAANASTLLHLHLHLHLLHLLHLHLLHLLHLLHSLLLLLLISLIQLLLLLIHLLLLLKLLPLLLMLQLFLLFVLQPRSLLLKYTVRRHRRAVRGRVHGQNTCTRARAQLVSLCLVRCVRLLRG